MVTRVEETGSGQEALVGIETDAIAVDDVDDVMERGAARESECIEGTSGLAADEHPNDNSGADERAVKASSGRTIIISEFSIIGSDGRSAELADSGGCLRMAVETSGGFLDRTTDDWWWTGD